MSRKKKKGTGDYQIDKRVKARKTLLKVLADEKWHQYSEIKEITSLSAPTLANHFKQLKKLKVIEKRIDTKSGKYPYPVFYRLKPPFGTKFKTVILTDGLWQALNEESLQKTKNPIETLEIISGIFKAFLADVMISLKKEPIEFAEVSLELFVWEPYRVLMWKLIQATKEMIDDKQIDIDQLAKDQIDLFRPRFLKRD
jgi:DNA-binding transcriptional ArsR family regulator